MLELQDPDCNEQRQVEQIACQVGDWAEEAFRTMVFGYKELTLEAFLEKAASIEGVVRFEILAG